MGSWRNAIQIRAIGSIAFAPDGERTVRDSVSPKRAGGSKRGAKTLSYWTNQLSHGLAPC